MKIFFKIFDSSMFRMYVHSNCHPFYREAYFTPPSTLMNCFSNSFFTNEDFIREVGWIQAVSGCVYVCV